MSWKLALVLCFALICTLSSGCSGHDQPGDGRVDLALELVGEEGHLRMLPPPISEDEAKQLREGFHWKETDELPETNAKGAPALYYFVVQIQNRDELAALDLAGFSWSFFPLFESELDKYGTQDGVLAPDADGHGAFAFVIAPGLAFNLIREHALQEQAIFTLMTPRPVPEEAFVEGGHESEISYEYLAKAGFEPPGFDEQKQLDEKSSSYGTVQQPLLGLILREVAKFVGDSVRDAWNGAGEILGDLAETLGLIERSPLTITVRLRNTDADFPAGSLMRGAIGGATRGVPASIDGAQVSVSSGVTTDIGTLNGGNIVTLRAVDGTRPLICVYTENAAALVTDNFISALVCRSSPAVVDGSAAVTVFIGDARLNVLAQITQGQRYFATMGQFIPRKVTVLVGNFADALAVGGRAFAPVFGGFTPGEVALKSLIESYVMATVGTFAAPFSPGGVFLSALGSVDIVLPRGDDVSRIIPTHEYGHVAFALMINAWNPAGFFAVWQSVINETLLTGGAPGAGNQISVVNEAVADYFSGQIAGGTSYVADMTAIRGTGPGAPEFFCDGSIGASCLEGNFGGPGAPPAATTDPFNLRVAAIASTIHDLYDGGPGPNPNNAAAWQVTGGALSGNVVPGLGPHAFDESVSGAGAVFFNGVGAWQSSSSFPVLTPSTFFRGQSAAFGPTGVTPAQLCTMIYIPHDPAGSCNDFASPL